MGWNGSENKGAASVPQKAERKSPPSKGRGLVALIVIVVGGAFAIWFFGGRGKPATSGGEGTRRPTKIAEVKPQIVTNKVEEKSPEPFVYKRVGNDIIGRNGKPLLPAARVAIERMLNKPKIVFEADPQPPNPRHIFQHDTENMLVDWMDIEPGQHVHMAEFPATLEEDFRNSMADPIRITADDTPEEAELKREMIETKKAIALEMGKGKTFLEVMDDYRRELNRTADAHNMCQQEMEKMLRQGASRQELEDFLAKANDMLEQDGCSPMKMNRSFQTKLSLVEKRRQAKENDK